ncbi:MAG: molybdenum ABC transporter ATP-binding protein [Gammaproteobacteria bacterium]|nr:molybdenum ABC transporter ATP-binding protein [Gammaproteobacteria bacterium]MDP2347894.1 molybdenum ABC transporter ATP-binding protein [Gammaproteobacteria bacterium]
MSLRIRAQLQRGAFNLLIDTALPTDGVTALFGRSGCGKTTLLRIIAGLERVRDAHVEFGDLCWQQDSHFVPTSARRIGLVFQEHSLLPHLSVKENLLYGYKRTPAELRRLHLEEVMQMLAIDSLQQQRIDQLSGGERQRISLGRALLTSPQLLLLDEPLSALDTQTKREIMPFLSRLALQAQVPIILITHSPDEVQRLANHVAFMAAGQITTVETLEQALARPDTPLFQDEGAAAILAGQLGPANEHGLRAFGSDQSRLWLQSPGNVTELPECGQSIRVRILARDVSVALDDPQRISMQNHLFVTIEHMHTIADQRVVLSLRLADGQLLLSEITNWSARRLELSPGQQVYALIKSVALIS